MIRSVGRTGPVKVTALVLWELRFDLLAMLAIAALVVPGSRYRGHHIHRLSQ